MLAALSNIALIFYACATGLALAYLVQREEIVHRLASLATLAGWVAHSIALIVLGVETGGPPFGSLPHAVSTAIWVVVLLEMLVERQYRIPALGAFVMPIVVVLSLKASAVRPSGLEQLGAAFRGAWVWEHTATRPAARGPCYSRLPDLQTLDRLTYRTLALGFPFLTTGLILGALWARTAWGSVLTFDPLASLSSLAWGIYAATLAGRAVAGLHGRRAAYFALFGFTMLVITLGAGFFLPGRHGS